MFAEEPTYFLAKAIFADHGLNVVQIPMDQDGINIEALEAQLEAGNIPKFLYTIPTAHNPTGRTMSVAKRAALVALGEKYGFHIIADEVYQLLTFPHVEAPPPMFTFDKSADGVVVSLGSFSKILAPALRLGWMEANPKVRAEILRPRDPPPSTQAVAAPPVSPRAGAAPTPGLPHLPTASAFLSPSTTCDSIGRS